jgi:signal transduction histidine kinase
VPVQRSSVLAPDGAVLVGQVAAALSAAGERGLADALDALVRGLGLRSAVLRSAGSPPGEVLAVAGEVVHAVPAGRDVRPLHGGPSVELEVLSADRTVALLVVHGARPTHLPVLRAATHVLGLVLRPTEDGSGLALVTDAETDRDALADALHDGPVQSLVVARYAADAAVRAGIGSDAAVAARDAVQEALVAVRRLLWHLRPRASDDLVASLADLAARQAEAGGPALELDLSSAPDEPLTGPAAATAYRLVQAACLAADGPVRVAVRATGAQALLDVHTSAPLPSVERLARRARATGAELSAAPGRVRLALPTGSPLRSTPSLRPKATP